MKKCLWIACKLTLALLLILPSLANGQARRDSLRITYTMYTSDTVTDGFRNCLVAFIGSHPDPLGNGNDYNYTYRNYIYARYVPGWSGAPNDQAGVMITFTRSVSGGWGPDSGKACDFSNHVGSFDGVEEYAYYNKPANKKPVASFTFEESGELMALNFDGSGSKDEDGHIVTYAWNFGGEDGAVTTSGPTTTHTFKKRGQYDVTLTVTDNDGDNSAPFKTVVLVEGPDMQIMARDEKFSALSSKIVNNDGGEYQVGDTIKVSVLVENTGDFPLRNIALTGGTDDLEVTSSRENTLAFASVVKGSIDRLEPGESDTLVYLFAASRVQESIGLRVRSVTGVIDDPVADGETYSVDIGTCNVGKIMGAEESNGCLTMTILPAPIVVNSTGDDPLQSGLDEEDGCSTGNSILRDGESEPECTLRAAMQHIANRTEALPIDIEFDIPTDDDVHTIVLDGPALPELLLPVSLLGSSQPNGRVEINGADLQSGDAAAFVLGGAGNTARIEGLAFFGFPGTVLNISGDGSVVEGCLFGSDWAKSYMSTDVAVINSMRNGGVAILVTGSDIRIGGFEGEGNLIIGSTYGVFVEGAGGVEILGNSIGVLESPHEENGVEVSASDDVVIGNADAPNNITHNLGHGIRVDATSLGFRVEGNRLERNRKDAVNIDLGGSGGNGSRIGGEDEGQGNTILRNLGAGIRITGGGVRAPGAEASLAVMGNLIRANGEIGVLIEGGSNVDIGGPTGEPGTGAGNDIEDGIRLIPGSGVQVMGNRIALLDEDTGTSLNIGAITVQGSANVVGGATPAHGNMIYGVPSPTSSDDPNDNQYRGFGVDDSGNGTLIRNNMIGTDGSSAFGLLHGVVLRGVDGKVHENLISGNGGSGISVRAPAQIWGNRIGTGATGNTALPNAGAGIEVFATATIGGEKDDEACESPCNVISGNGGDGILIRPEATGTKVQGNYIGLGANGLSVVGNAGSGIVALADNVVVGGPNDIELFDCRGACNIIAGNGGDGIRNYAEERYSTLSSGMGSDTKSAGESGSGGMIVQGNFIGTGLDIPGSGNAGHGVSLGALGSGNVIGGAVTGQGNLISGNGGSGVLVMASTRSVYFKGTQWEGGKGNSIRGNRIVNNARPAIDLYPNYILPGGDGWSPLSTEDLAYGPNRMINWPYIIESNKGFSFNDILVYWRGPAGSGEVNLFVDIYTSASCNGSYGNAQNFFVTRTAEFDAASGDTLRFQVPYIPDQPYYTATVTDSEGNTSELGNCRLAGTRPAKALANLSPNVRTQVGNILLSLVSGEAPDGSKTAQTIEVMVLSSDHDPNLDRFDAYAATTQSGGQLVPASVASQVWEVLEMAPVQNTSYQVCLPAPGGGADLVVMGRGPSTSGHWRAHDTYGHQADGQSYLCADAVSATAFALGSGDEPALAAPVLASPSHGDAEVDGGSPFRWEPVSGAASYELQLALDPAFSTLLMHEQNLTSTELMPAVLARSATHFWRVRAEGDGKVGPWSKPGTFRTSLTMVGLDGEDASVPTEYALSQNFPNPFNPTTTIVFALPQAGHIELRVIDMLGRRVATLMSGTMAAGAHQIQYDASRLSSGVYVYQLVAGRTVLSRKMTLVK